MIQFPFFKTLFTSLGGGSRPPKAGGWGPLDSKPPSFTPHEPVKRLRVERPPSGATRRLPPAGKVKNASLLLPEIAFPGGGETWFAVGGLGDAGESRAVGGEVLAPRRPAGHDADEDVKRGETLA